MNDEKLHTYKTIWSIYIELDDQMYLREVLVDVPVGRVYEAAAKYCRDEGWDHIAVKRRVVPLKRAETRHTTPWS